LTADFFHIATSRILPASKTSSHDIPRAEGAAMEIEGQVLGPRGASLIAAASASLDYLRSRGSVTVPGLRIARRAASPR
jgi:hypothetical protein